MSDILYLHQAKFRILRVQSNLMLTKPRENLPHIFCAVDEYIIDVELADMVEQFAQNLGRNDSIEVRFSDLLPIGTLDNSKSSNIVMTAVKAWDAASNGA